LADAVQHVLAALAPGQPVADLFELWRRRDGGALERLVTTYAPPELEPVQRQAWRIALFDFVMAPEFARLTPREVLEQLPSGARRRARRLLRADDPPRTWTSLVHEPAGRPSPPLPDPPLVALLCRALTPAEQRVLRAQLALYRQDPVHEPTWADVARVAGVKSGESARKLAERLGVKVRRSLQQL